MATTIYISDALEKKLKRFKDLYTSRISLELSLSDCLEILLNKYYEEHT